jgi:endonuclease VIII
VPEGQVSHRNALRLTAALAGRELTRVEAPEPRLAAQRIPERLAGDRVAVVEAAGKHHLIRFESGRTLHSHLMMSGVWRLLPAAVPVRRGGLWLGLWTADHVAAQYRGPVLQLLEPGERPRSVDLLGPDLLDEAVDPGAAAAARLARVEPSRQVGEALMDQRVVAGIGNVYNSETCVLCGVDPWRPVGGLSPQEAAALGATAARLMADDVRGGGPITTYRPPGGRPGSRETTWVYGRRGRPCRRCGTPIRAGRQGDGNRTTYWCPACQG